jgi:hypothetical protein
MVETPSPLYCKPKIVSCIMCVNSNFLRLRKFCRNSEHPQKSHIRLPSDSLWDYLERHFIVLEQPNSSRRVSEVGSGDFGVNWNGKSEAIGDSGEFCGWA